MATTTSGAVSPCLTYTVHLDSALCPIPSTMQGVTKIHKVASCQHKIATVPNYQVAVTKECRPKSHLRYFYLINSRTKKIVPNSMFSMTHKPKNMCTGVNSILEFIVQKTVS